MKPAFVVVLNVLTSAMNWPSTGSAVPAVYPYAGILWILWYVGSSITFFVVQHEPTSNDGLACVY
ncbi:hypothetical protein BpHYR1_026336 [Brachionus plicatilis]|uniref:Uncharacterized protein n=1 Tax=Brachionus plicatilis TaxID=10195 RepID=A0A3M7P7U0_BRAPC|nr:hypothetical protein BpHYR1_026336 [Brachionus plicatilis]